MSKILNSETASVDVVESNQICSRFYTHVM